MIFRRFNDIVATKISSGLKVDEVLLFNSLKECFIKNVYTDVIHGSIGMIDFDVPGILPTKRVRCEIGDLLIVSFNWNEIRYTLMQNKTMHKEKYYGIMPFTIPVKQHYVLANKPNIVPVGKHPYLHADILSSALLDSVGSFGVFYKNKTIYPPHEYLFNMNYIIANRMIFNSKVTPIQFFRKSKRKAKFIGEINNVVLNKGYKEIEACTNLYDFEFALRNMLIGTPISLSNNISDSILIKIIAAKITSKFQSLNQDNQVRNNFLEIVRERTNFNEDQEIDKYARIKMPDIVLIDNTRKLDNIFLDSCCHRGI